jgi:hypothetical protein
MRERRALTLDSVPTELLAGIARATSYRCEAPDAVFVPIEKVRGPGGRKLNREALESLATGLRAEAAMEPVPAYLKDDEARLADGLHRYRISLAAGFTHLPCRRIADWEAAELGID